MDNNDVPMSFYESLGKVLADLHNLPQEKVVEAGLTALTATEVRDEMKTLREEVQTNSNRPARRRTQHITSDDDDCEESEPPTPPRRRNQPRREENDNGKLKQQLPEFLGKSDPDVYLEWETNVDKVFSLHNYSEQYKVRAAIAEFRQNDNTWWLDVMGRRRRDGEDEITTWRELKM